MKLAHSISSLRLARGLRRILLAGWLLLCALPAVAAPNPAPAIVVSPPSIVKSFSAASVPLNSSVTLTFTIVNPNGATDLTGVSFNDNLPAGLIIANPDSLTGTCDPGVITPAVTSINLVGGTILAGSSCIFSVDVLAVAGGTQVNTTDPVTSNEGGTGNTATATVDVPLPDLTIVKSHAGNFRQGQVGAVYTITVSDSGGADTTGPVTVTDTLPAGLTATGISGPGWSCSAPPVLSCSRQDGLPAGTTFPDITLTVNVANNAAPSVTNTATVSGGGESNTGNDAASDITTVDQVADLIITKTHSGNFNPGQTGATYTLTVQNVGPGPSLGTVTVTDTLPNVPNTLVATNMAGTGWTCTLGTLTCTRADVLAAGGSYPAITLTVNVPNNIQANVTNTATVSGGGELNTANNTATDSTHIGVAVQMSAQIVNMLVTAGGVTSTVLNVDSSSGVGTLTFACSGLPVGAACSFNPASTAALSSQITMTVTTAPRSSSTLLPGIPRTPPFYAAAATLLALLGALLTLVLNRKRRLRLALGLVGLALLGILSGCGSSTKGTPAGNFTITVTATGAGGAGTTTLNLTVL
jgi:uncharacterized repeat protein (TIGR01451 family)